MTLGCPHGGRAPRNLPSIADRLIAAQAQCEAAGERWTAPRARTYELLVGTEHPVRAYDLRARFGPSRRAAKPATVYRALAFLLGLGLVHWVESRNLFVACTRPGVCVGRPILSAIRQRSKSHQIEEPLTTIR